MLQLQQILNQNESIPYDAIYDLNANCIYGGRISNKWDRRVLLILLSEYLNEVMVNDPFYRFAQHDGCEYVLPRRPERREVCQYIVSDIPRIDAAEIYGLRQHTYAHLELARSEQLIEIIVELPSRVNQTRTEIFEFDPDIMSFFIDLKEKLHANDGLRTFSSMEWTENMTPMENFLNQELHCFDILWQEIEWTCQTADRIFNGDVIYRCLYIYLQSAQ